jgi:AraC-like DNA-binding protein
VRQTARKVWRVHGLRDLELERSERAAARRAPHLHDAFEIGVVESGVQRIRFRGSLFDVGSGALVVIPPGEVHAQIPATDAVRYRSFFPDAAALADASNACATAPRFRSLVLEDGGLARRISRLHKLLETRGSLLRRQTAAVEAATLLMSRHAGIGLPRLGAQDARVALVRERLDAAVGDNVQLSELSTLTGLPGYTLVRAFVRGTGMPPHQYHLQVRINAAKRLLARGEPASGVAAATGFVDQSHLTRHFRRVVGMTPGAWTAARTY